MVCGKNWKETIIILALPCRKTEIDLSVFGVSGTDAIGKSIRRRFILDQNTGSAFPSSGRSQTDPDRAAVFPEIVPAEPHPPFVLHFETGFPIIIVELSLGGPDYAV